MGSTPSAAASSPRSSRAAALVAPSGTASRSAPSAAAAAPWRAAVAASRSDAAAAIALCMVPRGWRRGPQTKHRSTGPARVCACACAHARVLV
eukprot:82505-Prymnesium_polylepis.1